MSISAAIIVLVEGFIIVDNKYKKAVLKEENQKLQEEKDRLSQEFKDMLDEELRISHENMEKERNYVVNSAVEVGGKPLLYVSEPTQTPTPTPVYSRYLNTDSEEFIGAEDGVIHEKDNKVKLDF